MAAMNTRPMTPPQSAANFWTCWATEASGSEYGITNGLSAGDGENCSGGETNVDREAAERRFAERQLPRGQGDLLGDDRQAEPRSRCRRARPAGERLEEAVAVGGRDPRPVVLDADEQRVPVAGQADPHVSPCAAVQRGVVEEVVDQQAQAAVPAADPGVGDRVVELVRHRRVAASRGVERRVDE